MLLLSERRVSSAGVCSNHTCILICRFSPRSPLLTWGKVRYCSSSLSLSALNIIPPLFFVICKSINLSLMSKTWKVVLFGGIFVWGLLLSGTQCLSLLTSKASPSFKSAKSPSFLQLWSLHLWPFQIHWTLQLFTHGIASLFQVHGFIFIVIYCVSSLPLVWACSAKTSPGFLLLGCLQIEDFSNYCLRRLLKLWKFIWYVKKILERIAQVEKCTLAYILGEGYEKEKTLKGQKGT